MRTVRLLEKAVQDVDSILDWLINDCDAPEGAARWHNALHGAIGKLVASAHSFGFARENQAVDFELRQLVFKTRRGKPYRLIFTIDGDEVLVLRVRGPGQAPVDGSDLQ